MKGNTVAEIKPQRVFLSLIESAARCLGDAKGEAVLHLVVSESSEAESRVVELLQRA